VRASLLSLLLATICLAAPKPGDEGTAEYRTATALVTELGNARFTVREAAAKKLLEMGAAAIPALTAGTKSADEEVRNRSTALLPQAQAIEWNRRADAFLADTEGKQKHDLPLWPEWEQLIEKPGAASRKLFADMIRVHGNLLERARGDRSSAIAALAAHSLVLLDTSRAKGKQVEAPAANIAAVLFVQAVLKDQPTSAGSASRHEPLYLLANPAVATALDDKATGPAYRRLVVRWAESRPPEETMSGLFFALLAHRHPFPEADPFLIQLATARKNVQLRWVAMESLGKSVSKPALAKLKELLADTSPMYDDLGGKDAGHQVRDCALAALAHGRGKKPTDYGLTSYMTANFWVGGTADTITLHLCGFESAADRERGFKKWQAETAAKK
jgi:hypothetical protein